MFFSEYKQVGSKHLTETEINEHNKMNEIETLCEKIYSENKNRVPKQFIDFYEENQNTIEGVDKTKANPDYDGIMRLTSDYALSLSNYGSSKKAIPYLDKSIELFEDSSWNELVKIPMYEMLIWTRGVENYNNKNYGKATKDFRYLVKSYPDNEKYRNWLLASRTIKIKKWLNILWLGNLVSIGCISFIEKEDAALKNYLFIIAITFFTLAGLAEIINAKIKSNIKKNN